jgi:hypothetical protein
MGIDLETARFLIGARQSGVDFTRTATLGRQHLYAPRAELEAMLRGAGIRLTSDEAAAMHDTEYADAFFAALGAKQFVPIDASTYEGASEIHDMNHAIPERLHQSFDAVVDGGTLEHIFNFPRAIQNCMEMVRVGGHLILATPTNNYCGHGFYQFSPELYYRVLSPENGFEVERMLAYEVYLGGPWYEVADPAKVRTRVELLGSDHRVLLLICARRTREAPIFATTPQQSDYVSVWTDADAATSAADVSVTRAKKAGSLRRLGWRALRKLGPMGERAYHESRMRYLNRQLRMNVQPGSFRNVER